MLHTLKTEQFGPSKLATNSDKLSFKFHIFAYHLAYALMPIIDHQKLWQSVEN